MSCSAIPPVLVSVVAHIAAAVPARPRATFLDLLLGAAATKGGHVTDAILAAGLSRGWRTYYWFLERGRWSWLRVCEAQLEVLKRLFHPRVWYGVIDDSVIERVTTEAPGSLMHHNHNAKPNRPKFLRGQGWLCLAAVIERNAFAVGAVPLLLRLVRRGTNRGKLRSAGLLLRLLGQRLGHVRLLLDAWFMRAWLIHRALAAGHTVIGCVRRDLALFDVPKSPRKRKRGRPAKYGARLTPARVAALPEHRSAAILYGKLEVVRYRTGLVAARFLHGQVVRAIWVEGTGAPRLSRFGRLQLSWWRLPLHAWQSRPAECSVPQDLAAAEGNDAGLADTPDISAPSGRAATVGPGLSATPGMDTTSRRLRRGPGRPRASETGGQP